MAGVNLRRFVTNRDHRDLFAKLVKIHAPLAIADLSNQIIMGDAAALEREGEALIYSQQQLGWIYGDADQITLVSGILEHLLNQEAEKKNLAAEVLSKYKEVNLLYRLSERIGNMHNREQICELLLVEAEKLIVISDCAILLFNPDHNLLEVTAIHGQMFNYDEAIAPGCRIEGYIFNSGKGEVINEVTGDPRCEGCDRPIHGLICVPLKTRSKTIGVASFARRDQKMFTAEDLQLCNVLASQGAYAIENVNLYQAQLKDAVNRIEMEKGRKMQQDFLPLKLVQPQNWQVAASFKPAREVAGDFYDTFNLPSGGIGLVIADVCDKGVGSALFMALFRSLIRVFAQQTYLGGLYFPLPGLSTSEGKPVMLNLDHVNALKAVSLTNDYVAEVHSNLSMFATLFLGILDPKSGILSYVNGGHESLVVLSGGKIKARLKSTGPAVGMLPNMNFQIMQTYLEPGDLLFGYTDGVTEAKNIEGKFFTEKYLMHLLEAEANSAVTLLERLDQALNQHIGDAVQFDDITMIALERLS